MTDLMIDPVESKPGETKIDGRTKAGRAARAAAGSARAARENPRQTYPHEPIHEPQRSSDGRVVVKGHNGELLSRKRTQTGDMFAIPAELIPKDYEYQWCAVSIVGNTEILLDQNLMFAENGWRPVPAERHPGRFMPAGHKGNIVRGGQMLMERPKALCAEARYEDEMRARQQMKDRDQALMGGKANVRNSVPGGVMDTRYRGTGGDIRMSIDRALDIPAPSHELAQPGE